MQLADINRYHVVLAKIVGIDYFKLDNRDTTTVIGDVYIVIQFYC